MPGRRQSATRRIRTLFPLPLLLVFGAGVAWVAHITWVGRLGDDLDSPELASSVTVTLQLGALLAVAFVMGMPARARLRLAAGPYRLRWWHVAVSLNGGLFLVVAAYATPRLGAVLVTVAVVGGQVIGGLLVDRVGIGPVGQHPITLPRVIGVAIALVAVIVGAGGTGGDLHIWLLVLCALTGAGTAVQQAALGHMARATGQPVLAAAINTGTAGIAIWIVALVLTGGTAPGGWSAPPSHWIGGLFGASVLVLLSIGGRSLGVLRLMLGFVAGQTFGSLIADLISPPDGEGITTIAIVGLVLTITAVVVSGLGRKPRPVVPAPAET